MTGSTTDAGSATDKPVEGAQTAYLPPSLVFLSDPAAAVDYAYSKEIESNKMKLKAKLDNVKSLQDAMAEYTAQATRLSEWKNMPDQKRGEIQRHLDVIYNGSETWNNLGNKVTRDQLKEWAAGDGAAARDPALQRAAQFLLENPYAIQILEEINGGNIKTVQEVGYHTREPGTTPRKNPNNDTYMHYRQEWRDDPSQNRGSGPDGMFSRADLKTAILSWGNDNFKTQIQAKITAIDDKKLSLQTLIDMDMSDVTYLKNESNELSQGRSTVLKKSNEVIQSIIANLR